MNLQERFLSNWFEREGVKVAQFSELSKNCQNAVRILTQDDEDWYWEGVFNLCTDKGCYQVLKSIQNSHYL